MKRIIIRFECAPQRILMGDQIELDGYGGVKILTIGGLVAHVKGYCLVAFEDSLVPTQQPVDEDALA